jgi:hypothetical protein
MEWPFADTKDIYVFTLKHIIEKGKPILLVTHDADGDWQFLDGGDPDIKDTRVVSFLYIVHKDPSLLSLADLPRGWQAWRDKPDAPWIRKLKQY